MASRPRATRSSSEQPLIEIKRTARLATDATPFFSRFRHRRERQPFAVLEPDLCLPLVTDRVGNLPSPLWSKSLFNQQPGNLLDLIRRVIVDTAIDAENIVPEVPFTSPIPANPAARLRHAAMPKRSRMYELQPTKSSAQSTVASNASRGVRQKSQPPQLSSGHASPK